MPLSSSSLSGAFGAALLSTFLTSVAVQAETLPAPTGEVILELSGAISVTNGDGVLALDLALMAGLPQHSFTTSTIWTEGTATYTGVLLRDLLEAAGASGDSLTLTALNDYQITMPAEAAREDGPLVAVLVNGEPMSIRDKGPAWVIYPYDEVADYRTEETFARSIWQLNRIEVSD